jgi:hypothetical protein
VSERIALVINELTEELRAVEGRAAMLRETIANLQKLSPAPRLPFFEQAAPPPSVQQLRYAGMTVAQAAIAFLRSAAKPQKTRAIADALAAGGIESSNPYRAVYNSLRPREDVIIDEGDSTWSLKEWHEQ